MAESIGGNCASEGDDNDRLARSKPWKARVIPRNQFSIVAPLNDQACMVELTGRSEIMRIRQHP
jgi:hypothetical protein